MVGTAGAPFLEDYGLTACAFCGRQQALRLSHIIPKFVFDWLKRTSATGLLRVGYEVNRPAQDGFKTRRDLSRLFVSERAPALLPGSVENFLRLYGLRAASKAFEFLGVGGPATIRVVLSHVSGLEAAERDPWRADYTEGRSTWGHDILSFEEESSNAELQFNVEAVIARLMDRLMSAFGMWRK